MGRARKVLSGTTGALITEVDGKQANVVLETTQPLIELSMEQIVHVMTQKQIEINAAKSEAGRARKRVKDLLGQRDGMIAELIKRDADAHNLELDFGGGDEEEEEE